MSGILWSGTVQLLHSICAVAALVLALVLFLRRKQTRAAQPALAGAVATASWALAAGLLGSRGGASAAFVSLADLAWLWVLFRLFGNDQRDTQVRGIRLVVLALALVQVMQLALLGSMPAVADDLEAQTLMGHFAALFSLLFCVGALVLVHNLYLGASAEARETLRWPAGALAAMWLYDLNVATIAYFGGSTPVVLGELRAAAMIPALVFLGFGLVRHPDTRRLQPSRQLTLQSFSLLAIAAYLLAMVLLVQGLTYAGRDVGPLAQATLLLTAAALLLALLSSRKLRGWLRVKVAKHLFQHRYDYRSEWLRFTQTIGRADAAGSPLRERVVKAVADITDSPGGLLLTPREDGGLELAARWSWPEVDVPAIALSAAAARFFEQSQFILELDALRQGKAGGIPEAAHPQWLMCSDAWAVVPLMHFDRVIGVVVLSRPPVKRRLDWEDFDLLRVVGRQLASYLAEQSGQDALAESQRFEEFNRRIAFVMHDVKNLASQLSLLARNAEKHADNPDFRSDMLLTLRNSSDKLEALLARLGRYGTHSEQVQAIEVTSVLKTVAQRFAAQREVVAVERPTSEVLADREALEQALVHLVQNAIDASSPEAPVMLDVRVEDTNAAIEVVDSGCGMSAEFVRTRLFKPFQSSKAGGFGIGAFEAREMIRAMGGWLDVESREGLGTRFVVRLPLADAAGIMRTIDSSEVA